MRYLHLLITLGLLMTTAGIMSCSSDNNEETGNNGYEENGTEYVEDKGGALTPEQEQTYNAGVNGFTFEMFRTISAKHPQTSLISSPLSVASILAMLNDGAWGKTREELLSVLGFKDAKTRGMNEYFQKLMKASDAEGTTKLQMANAMFVRKGFEFKPTFVNDMKLYYDAKAETLDFDAPESVKYINDWCGQQTNGLIPELVSELPSDALSMLVNTIYFNGKWKIPFSEIMTFDRRFTREDNTQRTVKMMHMTTVQYDYWDAADYQALRMDYGKGSYNMTILLPKAGKTISDVVNSMSEESWQTLQSKLSYPGTLVNISLPRFSVEATGDAEELNPSLSKMGINRIFSPELAELPNILNAEGLYISLIKQKTVIHVTEEGTEAAAATYGLPGSSTGEIIIPIYFTADHPFVYIISNRSTGVIYFIGTYHG